MWLKTLFVSKHTMWSTCCSIRWSQAAGPSGRNHAVGLTVNRRTCSLVGDSSSCKALSAGNTDPCRLWNLQRRRPRLSNKSRLCSGSGTSWKCPNFRLIKEKVLTKLQSIDRSGYMCRCVRIRVFVIYLCVHSFLLRLVTAPPQATPLSYLTSHLSV